MITIKEIYQYTEFPPKPPSCLTPLQEIEWREQNSHGFNKFFVGELLVAAPAIIYGIDKDKIKASGNYFQLKMDENWQKNYMDSPYQQDMELMVNYYIFYDNSFYETVKLIHNESMIEFEGTITGFNPRYLPDNGYDRPIHVYLDYQISLRLSKIKVIKKEKLYSNLLNDKHYFLSFKESTNKESTNKKSNCFIATAAFGNQDITEVIQLRDFRDNILRNYFAGRCFISTYNYLSPPIALIIRQSNWLRKGTRMFLRKLILPLIK